jgi:hypothetical protein
MYNICDRTVQTLSASETGSSYNILRIDIVPHNRGFVVNEVEVINGNRMRKRMKFEDLHVMLNTVSLLEDMFKLADESAVP